MSDHKSFDSLSTKKFFDTINENELKKPKAAKVEKIMSRMFWSSYIKNHT